MSLIFNNSPGVSSAVVDFTSVTATGSLQGAQYVFIASYLVTGSETTADNNEELGLTRFIQTGKLIGMTGWTDSSSSFPLTLPDNVKRKMYKVISTATGSVGAFEWTDGSNSLKTIRMRSTGE